MPQDPWTNPEPQREERGWYPGRYIGQMLQGWGQRPQQNQGPSQSTPQQALDRGGFAPGAGTPEEQSRILSGQGGNQAAGDRAIQTLAYEGLRLRDEEQAGLDAAKELLAGMMPELTRHPLSERDINELAAGRLEEVAQGKMRDMMALREHLGISGIDGGVGADLGVQAEIAAMGQATQAMRGLRERHAELTGQHQMKLLATVGAAHQVLPAVSTYGAEAAEVAATHYGNMYAADRNYEAQKYAAKKQKEGAIFGGLLGLAGSVLGGIF